MMQSRTISFAHPFPYFSSSPPSQGEGDLGAGFEGRGGGFLILCDYHQVNNGGEIGNLMHSYDGVLCGVE